MGIWENFEGMVTVEEVMDAKENMFEKPTAGHHNCELLSITNAVTQQNQPQVRFKFRDLDTGKTLQRSMFLTNQNYPERTPQEIVRCINFIKDVTGEEITFTSFGAFEQVVENLPIGKKVVLNVKYKNEDSKYADIYFVCDVEAGLYDDESDVELPF